MALEIERKFLVVGDYQSAATRQVRITQGYLSVDTGRTVRIRRWGDRGFLTIKGAPPAKGQAGRPAPPPPGPAPTRARCSFPCVCQESSTRRAGSCRVANLPLKLMSSMATMPVWSWQKSNFPLPMMFLKSPIG